MGSYINYLINQPFIVQMKKVFHGFTEGLTNMVKCKEVRDLGLGGLGVVVNHNRQRKSVNISTRHNRVIP